MDAMLQNFWFRYDPPPMRADEVSTLHIQHQLYELTSLVHQMVVGNTQQVNEWRVRSAVGHPTNICPTIQGEGLNQEYAVRNLSSFSRQYDPYTDMYGYEWRDHPNFYYGGNTRTAPERDFYSSWQQQGFPLEPPGPQNSSSSLEEIVKSLALNQQQFQQDTKSSIQNLENQISHMAAAIIRLEAQVEEELLVQSVVDESAIMLEDDREVKALKRDDMVAAEEQEIEEEIEKEVEIEEAATEVKVSPKSPFPFYTDKLLFPSMFSGAKEEDEEKALEIFRKMEETFAWRNKENLRLAMEEPIEEEREEEVVRYAIPYTQLLNTNKELAFPVLQIPIPDLEPPLAQVKDDLRPP